MSEFFPLVNIGNMNLERRCGDSGNRIRNCHRSMRIASRIEQNGIKSKSNLMDFIDQFSFHITLEIMEFDLGKAFLKIFKEVFESFASVDFRFPLSE